LRSRHAIKLPIRLSLRTEEVFAMCRQHVSARVVGISKRRKAREINKLLKIAVIGRACNAARE
jgi:hypothetical protein